MALTALNMSATFFLASKSDPKYDEDIDVARENGATIFEIGYLPKEVCAELQDASQEAVQSIENGISTTYKSSAASATTNKKPQEDAESLQSDTQDETKTATKKDTGKTP